MISINSLYNRWSFLKGKKIYVGVSGGVDSVVLMRIFKSFDFDITALHVNYKLRESESDKDEEFVKLLCEELNIPLFIKQIDTKKLLYEKGGNLQEVARKIRYEFYQSFVSQQNDSFFALAHHQDDQVETFFLNLARKSGLRGMSCMLEEDGFKIRPLLNYTKQEIIDFAKIKCWNWREDLSNQSIKYRRNLLRNRLIPEMKATNPEIQHSVIELIRFFQGNLKDTQNSIETLFEKVKNTGNIIDSDFLNLTENQQVELLFQLGFESNDISSFHKLFSSQKGKFIKLKNRSKVFRESNGFSFEAYYSKVSFQIINTEVEALPIHYSKSEFYFDKSKIKGEIRLREWTQGDRIAPIGLKGSKLISDVLNDSKMAAIDRLHWPILIDDEGILACPLISVSKEKVADKNTKKIICIRLERITS